MTHEQTVCLHGAWNHDSQQCDQCGVTQHVLHAEHPFPLVVDYAQWCEFHEENDGPLIDDVVERHNQVLAAISRYRILGKQPKYAWLLETGLTHSIAPRWATRHPQENLDEQRSRDQSEERQEL